jgi:hypothetical protein
MKCRSCRADVIFLRNAKSGSTVILDALPIRRYVMIDDTLSLHGLVGLIDSRADSSDPAGLLVETYTDHHATCPNAAEWEGE